MLIENEGKRAKRGGYDLTISLTPDQAEALGVHAYDLAEALDTVLVAIAAARTGADPVDPKEGHDLKDTPVSDAKRWSQWVIGAATTLLDRVDAVRAAAIREHAEQGGSYGELANAMSVTRATAQTRRNTIVRSEPTPQEQWVSSPAPKAGPGYHEAHAFGEDEAERGRERVNIADGNMTIPGQVGQVHDGATFTNIASGGVHIGRRIDGDVHGNINISGFPFSS